MLLSTWITFVIAGTIMAISPGSGAVLSMSHGLAYGVKKASATVLGLQLGLLLRQLVLLHQPLELPRPLELLLPGQGHLRMLVRTPATLLPLPKTGQPPGQRTNGYS